MVLVNNCHAQWLPDVRLSYTDSASVTCEASKQIASTGNYVHVVWADGRNGYPWEIYYKRSTDKGINWGPDIRLSTDMKDSYYPSIAVSGSVVHVIWSKHLAYGLYYKRSTDAGVTWEPDVLMVNPSSEQAHYIAVLGSTVHIVWQGNSGSNTAIFYKRSTDAGTSWGANIRLTNYSTESTWPCISVSGSNVHVIWVDLRYGYPNYEIMYIRSTDEGVSWGTETRLTNNPSYSTYCDISSTGQYVHVVWLDFRFNSTYNMFYKRSTDGGITWGADKQITFEGAHHLSVVSSGQFVHLLRYGLPNKIFYKRSTNYGTSWADSLQLTNNIPGVSVSYSSLSISGDAVHVIWSDTRNTNNQIYYRRNPTGNTIGIQNISSEIPSKFSLSQNYPNPFNPTTKIQFKVASSKFIKLTVFDLLGKEIEALVNEKLQPGTYEVDWNGSDYSSGVYFYRLKTEDFSETKRMILIK